MDPHQVLGIDRAATQEEIKLAYRRVAMKWHPDRNDNSPESRERFHQAALAYKLLFERASRGDRVEPEDRPSCGQRDDDADPVHADSGNHPGEDNSQDDSAESTFWDAMLDYAIKLAQNGMSENEIRRSIGRNGYNLGLLAIEEPDSRLELRMVLMVRANHAPWVRNDHTGFEVMLGDMATFTAPEETARLARAFWR